MSPIVFYFTSFILYVGIVGLGFRTDRVLIALSQPCLSNLFLIIIIIIIIITIIINNNIKRNLDFWCCCDYMFIVLNWNRSRLGCVESLMSLYKPTLHATATNLCIVFQCKLNKFCIMSCENKLVYLV